MLYLLNAFSLNMITNLFDIDIFIKDNTLQVEVKKITLEEAKRLVKELGFKSAIGHQSTAEILSELLGTEVKFNRININLTKKDLAIVFQLKSRLEEGKVLTKEEIKNLKYEFFLIRIK